MFQEEFKKIIINFEEGCFHWLDYEIYYALSDEAQHLYLKNIDAPAIIFNSINKKISLKCKNKFSKKYHKNGNDCFISYKNSMNDYFKKFIEMQDFS